MADENEIRIVYSCLGYALIGAAITATAAVVCFWFGLVALGIILSLLFVGAIDGVFRRILTTINLKEKSVTVTDYSLWCRPRSNTYEADDIEAMTVDWVPGQLLWMQFYQISLRPKSGGKRRLKVVTSKRKAEALRDRLAGALLDDS